MKEMFKGKYIDVYLTCEEGLKAVHIVFNIPEKDYKRDVFFDWIEKNELKKKHYEEDRIEGSEDLLKVELVAFLEADREEFVKTNLSVLEGKLGVSKEKLYISEISDKLIIDSSPYYMTSSKTGKKDLLLPIYSKKHFIRSLDDLIIEFGYDLIAKFSRYYYTSGYAYLGRQYLDKCQGLSLDHTNIEEPANKSIIQGLFSSCYAAEITDIAKKEVEGKTLIKVQVLNNFFLYHPTYESRLEVQNLLLSPVIDLKVRNCALFRDILTGFFERVFYDAGIDTNYSPKMEEKRYVAVEYDYQDGENYLFDFESPHWVPVSQSNKIGYYKWRNIAEENPDARIECCKGVNLMKRYRVFIEKSTRQMIPWKNLDLSDANILPLDYISFTQNRVGHESLKEALGFKKRVDVDFYVWRSDVNKVFYDFFFTETDENPKNSEFVKEEETPAANECTFYIYDKEFLSFE